MKRSLVPLVIVALGVGMTACGGKAVGSSSPASRTASTSGLPPLVHDNDGDFDGAANNAHYDPDDYKILAYGREAGPVERGTITALVKRYYAFAAAENGQEACSLMSTPLAESIIEIYGHKQDPTAPRDESCAAVAAHIFKLHHGRLRIDAATITVTDVRLGKELGYALLTFRGKPDRHLLLYDQSGSWKIDEPLDSIRV